jgi:hypothetical protein
MGTMRSAHKTLVGKLKDWYHFGDVSLDGSTIVTEILKEMGCKGVDWIHVAPVAGFCEHCNEPSGRIKGGKFLDYLSDH